MSSPGPAAVRSSYVIVSQRSAASLPAAMAVSRCAQVRLSEQYQRSPCLRASRVATVVLPEALGPPIHKTCSRVVVMRASVVGTGVSARNPFRWCVEPRSR